MLESAREENTKTKRYIVEAGVSKCPVHPPRRDKNRVSIKRTGVDRAARQGIQRIVTSPDQLFSANNTIDTPNGKGIMPCRCRSLAKIASSKRYRGSDGIDN
jgi:hypothetical protein